MAGKWLSRKDGTNGNPPEKHEHHWVEIDRGNRRGKTDNPYVIEQCSCGKTREYGI